MNELATFNFFLLHDTSSAVIAENNFSFSSKYIICINSSWARHGRPVTMSTCLIKDRIFSRYNSLLIKFKHGKI